MSTIESSQTYIPQIPDCCNVPVSAPINLKGKAAIVTGAKGGIGQAACYALARAGAKVTVSDITACEETIEGLKAIGAEFIYIKTDVTQEADCNNLTDVTLEKFGSIDILVSNAGILDHTPIDKLSLEEWNRVINVDLTGTFLSAKAVWNPMKQQKSGRIICLSSLAARIGGALSGPHYVAAKAGVGGLVKWCAKYGAPDGILVNAIAPGLVWTPMTTGYPYPENAVPVGRIGRPEDIAETIVFLASDMSNYITGCMLDVNGGFFMTL
jgi:NAD(P)-dependent dehydrogenase (short-subunit alcohol dehydrogenase family)